MRLSFGREHKHLTSKNQEQPCGGVRFDPAQTFRLILIGLMGHHWARSKGFPAYCRPITEDVLHAAHEKRRTTKLLSPNL